MTHQLKSCPGEFENVRLGIKCHEIRTTKDREFTKGDDVILSEWNPAVYEARLAKEIASGIKEEDAADIAEKAAYTGRQILRTITYVSKPGSWGLPADLCVFSIQSYKNTSS